MHDLNTPKAIVCVDFENPQHLQLTLSHQEIQDLVESLRSVVDEFVGRLDDSPEYVGSYDADPCAAIVFNDPLPALALSDAITSATEHSPCVGTKFRVFTHWGEINTKQVRSSKGFADAWGFLRSLRRTAAIASKALIDRLPDEGVQSNHILQTYKHRGLLFPKGMIRPVEAYSNKPWPVRIFISYSRRNSKHVSDLVKHLKPQILMGKIDVWYDREIQEGSDWWPEIKYQIDASDIIVLVVTSDYFNSEWCQVERTYLVEKVGLEGKILLPVVFDYCQWDEMFGQVAVLQPDDKPVKRRTLALSQVAGKIGVLASEFLSSSA